jgi:hypothetical protein
VTTIHTKSALVASPLPTSWAYVHEFILPESHVYILIAKNESQSIDPNTLWSGQSATVASIKETLLEIEQQMAKEDSSSFLKQSLGKLLDKYSIHGNQFQVVAARVGSGTITCITSTGPVILLLRRGQLIKLNQTKARLVSVSGQVHEGDTYLLSSRSFIKQFPLGVLKAALSLSTPLAVTEHLAPTIMSLEDPTAAALCLKFASEEVVEQTVEPHPVAENIARYVPETGVKASLVRFIDSLLTKIPQKRMYVNPIDRQFAANSRRKAPVFIGFALLAVLSLSVVAGIQRRGVVQKEQSFESEIALVQKDLEEAKSLQGVEQGQARELLLRASHKLSTLKEEYGERQEYGLLAQSVEESLGSVAGIYKSPADLFLDLSLVSSGFIGERIVSSEDRMLVLDKERNKLLSIEIDNKKTQVVAGPSVLNNVLDMTLYADRNFVLDDTGISEVEASKTRLVEKTWGNRARILAFAGNIYLLDQEQNTINRFAGLGGQFSSGSPWLSEGSEVNFSDAISWAIDGAIWILDQKGEIDKFSLGREEVFLLTTGSKKYEDFYTDENADSLYLLDRENGKIEVYDKRGNYKLEYQSSELTDATHLIVSEPLKKIIFLTGSKLYSLDLKHL